MSNKTQGKLAFNVSKSDNKSGVHNIKSTSITQRDPIKKNTPVKKNILTTKRKRKSTETTNVKNQTITQFFTPSKCTLNTTATTSVTTSNNNNNIETSSSSVPLQTLFSSKNTTHASLSDSNDNTDEENLICYIRNIHSVKEIWTSIVGEYGGESIRRVRPRTEGQGNMYDDNEDKEISYLNEDEDNMIRPVRCKMSVQESLDFFKEITNEFLCV
ncbi:hypothetical protein BDC45DRAFT_569680 [Circinella umbellata]|nr:hypothetical protein BDC45DRAFT_569680 [Circinella umbellata]